MKLVIGLAILLTLAKNKVHGGFIGNHNEESEGQRGELNNEEQTQGESRIDYGGQEQSLGYAGQEQSLGYGGQEHSVGYGGQEHSVGYGGQEQQDYEAGKLANQEQQLSNEASDRHQVGLEAENLDQWQGGFQASAGFGEGQQDHSALSSLSGHWGGYEGETGQGHNFADAHGSDATGYANFGSLAAHGINVHGQEFDEQNEHLDLKSSVEVQHHHIPTKTVEHTKPYHVSVLKKIGVPVPQAVGVPTPQIIKVPVPQPYAVHVPVPHPISVPIYKLVPQEIEKRVPIEVQKLVPVYVDKPYKIEVEKHHVEYVDKPYAVHVPVYKHIYHHVSKHGSGGHSGGQKKW